MTALTCTAQTILGTCSDLADALVVGGCRHEHVKERLLCSWHAEDLLKVESRGVCGECFDEGHDCAVLARIVEVVRR